MTGHDAMLTTTGGVKVRVRDEPGTGSGDAVLLLHGLGLDLTSWDGVAAGLTAAGFRTVRLDWRAHGESAAPGTGYAFADLADDVWAVLDELGIGRVHLAGHSLGGSLAAEAALRLPGRVRSLSVLGGLVAGAPPSPEFAAWAGEVAGLAQQGLAALTATLTGTVMYRTRSGLRVAPALHDAAFVPENFASAYAAATAPRTSWDRLRDGDLAAPVLFLTGADDPGSLLPPAELAASVPQATGVQLPDAGHLAPLEQPDAVAGHLLETLRRAG